MGNGIKNLWEFFWLNIEMWSEDYKKVYMKLCKKEYRNELEERYLQNATNAIQKEFEHDLDILSSAELKEKYSFFKQDINEFLLKRLESKEQKQDNYYTRKLYDILKELELVDDKRYIVFEDTIDSPGSYSVDLIYSTHGKISSHTLNNEDLRYKIIERFENVSDVLFLSRDNMIRLLKKIASQDTIPETIKQLRSILEKAFSNENGLKNNQGEPFRYIRYVINDIEGQHIYSFYLEYKIPSGLNPEKITSKDSALLLNSYFRGKEPLYLIEITENRMNAKFYFEVIHRELTDIYVDSLIPGNFFTIPLGYDIERKETVFIQLEPTQGFFNTVYAAHWLINGATGFGKTNGVKSFLYQTMKQLSPQMIQFILVDCIKRVTFNEWEQTPWLHQEIIKQATVFEKELDNFIRICEERYAIFASFGVENIQQYRMTPGAQNMPVLLLVIDEFQDTLDQFSFIEKEYIVKKVKRLAQMGASAGFHLLIITQRSSGENVDAEIKANILGRISYGTSTEIDSYFALDAPIAAKLHEHGVCYIKIREGRYKKLYVPFISSNKIKERIHLTF